MHNTPGLCPTRAKSFRINIKRMLCAITDQHTPLAPIRLSFAQLRVGALTLRIIRGAERAPQKRTCATSAPADARRGTGPERARAAGCANRRTGAAGGEGRYSDQAGCRSWADEARTLRRTGKRGRSDRRTEAPARPCQPRGPPPPQRNAAMRNAPDREATAPERNLAIAERCGRNAGRCISRASTVGAVDRAR